MIFVTCHECTEIDMMLFMQKPAAAGHLPQMNDQNLEQLGDPFLDAMSPQH